MISHPLSPFKGQHYTEPVELIDIFPTLNDILGAPYNKEKVCANPVSICHPLQGKSLAKVVWGNDVWQAVERTRHPKHAKVKGRRGKVGRILKVPDEIQNVNSTIQDIAFEVKDGNLTRRLQVTDVTTTKLEQNFAITQSWRCANKPQVMEAKANPNVRLTKGGRMGSMWLDGDKTKNPPDEICVMGYSMRTSDFRYTAWFHYNRHLCVPILDVAPFEEEVPYCDQIARHLIFAMWQLYDHRGETLADFTHQEIVNLIHKPGFESIVRSYREQTIAFVRTKVIFRGCFVG